MIDKINCYSNKLFFSEINLYYLYRTNSYFNSYSNYYVRILQTWHQLCCCFLWQCLTKFMKYHCLDNVYFLQHFRILTFFSVSKTLIPLVICFTYICRYSLLFSFFISFLRNARAFCFKSDIAPHACAWQHIGKFIYSLCVSVK